MTHVLIDNAVHAEALAALRALPGVTAAVADPIKEEPRALPAQEVRDVEIFMGSYLPTNLEDMKKLRLVQLSSAGYSQLYGLNLVEKKVRACNALGVFDLPIAEWNVAMMVNLIRDLRGMIHNQEKGIWDRSARFQRELNGCVLGLWGYGGIGRQTARLAKALGMTVHVLVRRGVTARGNIYCLPGMGDPEGKLPDRVFNMEQKEEFLRGLDFLVLALPLTAQSEGLLGEAELKALPKTAFLLNPARGPLIKEQALLRALREGWIAGAALDTHYHYPMPPEHPLWHMDNVIMTPHISGSSLSSHYLPRVWDILLQNVQRYLAGKELLNELTAGQLSGG